MKIGELELSRIHGTLDEVCLDIVEAYKGAKPELLAGQDPYTLDNQDPYTVIEATRQLLAILAHCDKVDTSSVPSGLDLSELGDHGFIVLERLTEWAHTLQLQEAVQRLHATLPSLALFIAARGGTLRVLEPLTNALAAIANELRDTAALEALDWVIRRIIAAVNPAIKQDMEKTNPGRPWRILLLNYCIVATRSHNSEHMEAAFETLVHYLPEEASAFFHEGMRQIDTLDYPQAVRSVMQRWYERWVGHHPLH